MNLLFSKTIVDLLLISDDLTPKQYLSYGEVKLSVCLDQVDSVTDKDEFPMINTASLDVVLMNT